ncbi:MAG TPA: hypothetical protein VLI93_16765 [Acetobacteraceae bacterium]|nr:hypothetical protein [Acetobacteraceae bacterium]
MPFRAAVLGTLLALGACAPSPPVDTAQMPPISGLADPANAIQYSAWAFASPTRTQGDPISAARAVAAMDFAAGAINTTPSFQYASPIINDEMLQARQAVRRALGIAPNARSQVVVTSMIGVSLALAHGDRAAALTNLSAPIYTLGPEQTLALLTNMPFIHTANVATIEAEGSLNGTFCMLGCGGNSRL